MAGNASRSGLLQGIIIPLTRRLLKIPYLQAVREAFYTMMPVIILLTLVQMAGVLLCNPQGPLLADEGLGLGSALTGGLHDQAYRESSFFTLMTGLMKYLGITSLLGSLLFALVLADKLALLWQAERILALLCTVSAYVFLLAAFPGDVYALALYFSGRSFFLALLIASCSVCLFARLTRCPWLRLPIAAGLFPEMAASLQLFLPLSITLLTSLLFAFVWFGMEQSFLSLPLAVQGVVAEYVAQSPAVAIVYEFLRRLLWWLGLNGNSLSYFWNEAFYVPAQQANELGGGHFVFTAEFFDANSISLLGLAVSVWVFSYREKLRQLSAYSLPCLLFSINEPFLFALPIVLNPLFLVPYLLAPVLNVWVGYLAIDCGIVPLFRYTVESTAPVFLQGFLATGDVMGAVLQLVWLSLDIVIYTPFVIIFNMLTRDEDAPKGGIAHET